MCVCVFVAITIKQNATFEDWKNEMKKKSKLKQTTQSCWIASARAAEEWKFHSEGYTWAFRRDLSTIRKYSHEVSGDALSSEWLY